MPEFLPISRADMQRRGWEQCDFVYIIGDGYVDHPSFGHAIISRVLEDAGYKIGIISQPDWKKPDSINVLGEPRLGFLVMGGNMDSMVNHYTVSKAHRKQDAYTPGGVMGKRPDYAVTVYCNLIRRTYRRKPIVIGGIEASLRRLAHYDYWSDKLKRSILLDSQADLLIYGMGERAVIEIANALNDGMDAQDITYIDGTVYKTREPDTSVPSIMLPAFPDMQKNPRVYAESFSVQYRNTDPFCAKRLIEPYGEHEFIVQNPPQKPLSQKEMDHVYDLPYCRTFHPSYKKLGGIPAIAEIEFSLTSCRGCFGACSFCALTFHQGRIIQTRSQESIIKEAEGMTHTPGFKGYIHDVGAVIHTPVQPKRCGQDAKCPEVIIGDTKILAAAPAALKSAGFGDMVSKYIALIDWQVSNLLTGESYCERVAALTRQATDQIFAMAGRVTKRDEKTAAAIFESLLLTGIAMSFTKTSRPGSGTEHIMAHFWECMELLDSKTPNYHG